MVAEIAVSDVYFEHKFLVKKKKKLKNDFDTFISMQLFHYSFSIPDCIGRKNLSCECEFETVGQISSCHSKAQLVC